MGQAKVEAMSGNTSGGHLIGVDEHLGKLVQRPEAFAKGVQELADGAQLGRVRVAEEHNVVGKKGDARGRMSVGEPLKDALGDGMLEQAVKGVDDDGE